MKSHYDFGGYATRNDIKCADGRTIRKDAFKSCDGITVPLVWQHIHDDAFNVLGHALLENRDDGVYAYCKFNDTPNGQNAKMLVQHGDITNLSIYANKLKQRGGDVLHGMIREVSLVLAGANPGAHIEELNFEHSEDADFEDGEAVIFNDDSLELSHAEESSEGQPVEGKENSEKEPAKKEEDNMAEEKTVKEVFDSLTEEQKNVVYALVGQAVEDAKKGDNKEESENMKHNAFEENEEAYTGEAVLSHDAMEVIFEDARKHGSLKDAVLAHSEEYGIDNIEYLFPDFQNVQNTPEWVKRPDDWVTGLMNGVHKSPMSRVKSMAADITADEARAKGYTKGNRKLNEVFTLLKRTTSPCTVYKKQKLDRDDIIDIKDFDVASWLKTEMRSMLNEELARAILIGDGRESADEDKIPEDHIRPVWTDDTFFTVNKVLEFANADDDDARAKMIIKAAIKARKEYRGSGNPVFYTTEDVLSDMLLLEDSIGHRLYKTEAELATAMRVSKIVTVPVMENQTRTVGVATHNLIGLILNPNDYNVGADKGGSVNMFEDFDIDFNQMKYLIETRCSGALTKYHSAIAIEWKAAT